MTDAKVKFGKLSLNNQYQVHFAGFNSSVQNYLRNNVGILNADDFISREMGILCFDASLPATALATAEVKDNFMGVPQEFAHSRLYTDIDFSFYVDQDYTLLRIFEGGSQHRLYQCIDYQNSLSAQQGVFFHRTTHQHVNPSLFVLLLP